MKTEVCMSQSDWDKENTEQCHLKFNLRTDADIIAFLESVPNMQGVIKALLREEIDRVLIPDWDNSSEYGQDSYYKDSYYMEGESYELY